MRSQLVAVGLWVALPVVAMGDAGGLPADVQALQTQLSVLQTTVQTQSVNVQALQDSVRSLGSTVSQLQTAISQITPAQASPVGWALISMYGYVYASFNITSAMIVPATDNPGTVCFRDLPFTVHAMGASPVAEYGAASENRTMVSVGPNALALGCDFSPGDFTHVAFLTAYEATSPVSGGGPFTANVVVWFW